MSLAASRVAGPLVTDNVGAHALNAQLSILGNGIAREGNPCALSAGEAAGSRRIADDAEQKKRQRSEIVQELATFDAA